MKKVYFIFAGIVCLLLIGCQPTNEPTNPNLDKPQDPRDAILGKYNYEQVGSVTLSYQGQDIGTIPMDSKGTFTLDKNTTTTTGLRFYGSDLLKEAYLSDGNILHIEDAYESYTESGATINYTVRYSPCPILSKTFTTTATVSGTMYAEGESIRISGRVSLNAVCSY